MIWDNEQEPGKVRFGKFAYILQDLRMSALPAEADIGAVFRHVGLGPIGDVKVFWVPDELRAAARMKGGPLS